MSRNNIKRETYRDRDGNLQQAEKYTVRFLDIRGHERKLAASKNLKVAQDIKRMLETLRENRLARTRITSYNVCYTKLLRSGIWIS